MRTAKWKCMGCRTELWAEWTGPAFVMAKECGLCGKVMLASEDGTVEDGCMKVEEPRRVRWRRLARGRVRFS